MEAAPYDDAYKLIPCGGGFLLQSFPTLQDEDIVKAASFMNCPQCGNPISPTDRFCPNCGADLGVEETIPRDLSAKETIVKITELGGLAVASHPYRFWSGLGEENVRNSRFEAIEVANSRSLKKENRRSLALAKELKCGMTGGSDSHTLEHIGKAYTVLQNPTWDVDEILEEIRKGNTKGEGAYRRPRETPRYVIGCVSKWLKRGMKDI